VTYVYVKHIITLLTRTIKSPGGSMS
jgi:hypothetical protein